MNDVSIGTISARGQVAIPLEMRQKMKLKEGEKVLFALEDGTLMVKKVSDLSWTQITEPIRKAKKKIREDQVNDLVHRLRSGKK